MTPSLWVLAGTAAMTGAVHTVAGPDHVLPFLALSRLKRWSLRRTLGFTLLCGLGHVGSSIVLGALWAAFGFGVSRLGAVETRRGELATILTLGVGFGYVIWGLVQAARWSDAPEENGEHDHGAATASGHVHAPDPDHAARAVAHGHPHVKFSLFRGRTGSRGRPGVLSWSLFLIFVFGPCEPLIPLLAVAGGTLGWGAAILVGGIFSLTTLATMVALVVLGTWGTSFLPWRGIERYGTVAVGAVLLVCGLTMTLGL